MQPACRRPAADALPPPPCNVRPAPLPHADKLAAKKAAEKEAHDLLKQQQREKKEQGKQEKEDAKKLLKVSLAAGAAAAHATPGCPLTPAAPALAVAQEERMLHDTKRAHADLVGAGGCCWGCTSRLHEVCPPPPPPSRRSLLSPALNRCAPPRPACSGTRRSEL